MEIERIQKNYSEDRIRALTSSQVNEEIDALTERHIRGTLAMGENAIHQRLKELNREWDIDRALMLNFSVVVFLELLRARQNKKWLWAPLLQTPFLFLHATVGWCPPSVWLRKMGFRTRQEIERERDILLSSLQKNSLC